MARNREKLLALLTERDKVILDLMRATAQLEIDGAGAQHRRSFYQTEAIQWSNALKQKLRENTAELVALL